jgi:translocator protein
MQKISTLKILSLLAFIAVLVVNYLANALPLNGVTTGDISNKYYNEFAPAGITFSIWGIIYLLLIGTVIWQFNLKSAAIDNLNKWFIANSLVNVAWLLAWHYEIMALTLILMIGILFTLVQINKIIVEELPDSLSKKWLPKSAFGVYLGWICIATIANFTTFLVYLNFNKFGLSDTFWTGAVIGIGSITAAMLVVRYRNIHVGLAVIWALAGIIIRQNQLHDHFTAISWAAVTYGLAVVASLFFAKRRIA